ncbi:MAG: hypothetical protein NTY19_41785 [Planctomycetota bacterium]|nr:hypothetical protein [Planctomycetota bacterium]
MTRLPTLKPQAPEMDAAEITAQLTEGTILEGPHWTEPVKMLTAKQPLIEKDLINSFAPKDGNAEDVGVAVQIMDTMVERRERLFRDLRKIIVDYECSISGGRLTLEVRSAPIPKLG